MAEKPSDNSKAPTKQALDLNSLSGLDFGPNWADDSKKYNGSKSGDSRGNSQGRGSRPAGNSSRDRRSGGARPAARGGEGRPDARGGEGRPPRRNDGRDRNEGRGGDRRAAPVREMFQPTVQVDLYPQDEAFEALVQRLRSTARTYQLFEIAQLLLQKPERYVVVVSNKATPGESAEAPLFYSVPGHLPFETEEAAISHVLANNLDQFFDIEEIEVDAPKGNFQMVNRCTITGELIGPPNYHRYQEFLQRHYSARITGMSFECFTSKIEAVKEQEQIEAWMESMKKGTRYTVKDHQAGEPEALESLEAVRHFLLQHRKEQVVGSGSSIRFAGRDIANLPAGDIRRSVEAYVAQQIHFPLETANNIRGRLRRHKFTVYKKGSKGISFVCAVKRKFRDSQTIFTDSIRDLIVFLEQHPDIPASKLPKLYIGIDTEKQKPAVLEVTEAEVAAAKEAVEKAAAEKAAAGDTTEVADEVVEAGVQAETAAASTEATPVLELSAEDQKRLNQLMLDLRWLITEGYVTEYGDGRLFAAPPMPEPKKKEAPVKVQQPAVVAAKPVVAELETAESAVVEPATPEVAQATEGLEQIEVSETPEKTEE